MLGAHRSSLLSVGYVPSPPRQMLAQPSAWRLRRHHIRCLAAAVLVQAFVSCSDPVAPPPRGETDDLVANYTTSSGDQFEEIASLVMTTSGYLQESVDLPALPTATMVEVVVSGYIRQSHNTVTSEINIGPGGYYTGSGCLKGSSVIYSSGRTSFSCYNHSKQADTAAITVQGTGKAYIAGGYSDWCYPPGKPAVRCYTYSGQRAFTIRAPRPTATLTASRKALKKGVGPDTVRFRVDWAQKKLRTSTIPVQVQPARQRDAYADL